MSYVRADGAADMGSCMRANPTSTARRLPRLVVPLLLAGLLSGCNLVVMNPTGDIAIQQRNLILIATGLMLLIIVPVLVLVVVFAWRYRKGGEGTYDPDFDHSTSLELVIWACPLLIIIFLGAVTWSSTHLLDPFRPLDRISAGRPLPENAKTLDVQVVAMDWKWLFILPEQGVAAINELALPVDVPVRFTITSTSQMNTFYAPTMAGMIYAMPGMQSTLHAVLNQQGDSWGYSANYTGAGFSDMRFKLRAVDQAGFDRWIAELKSGEPLAQANYLQLEKPSEAVPVMHFGSVEDRLFDRVLNRCIQPGQPCMNEVMRQDMERMGGQGGMPASHGSMPRDGEKPTPALEKAPEDKGSGPNVTKPPAGDQPPGETEPGHEHNRNMSAVTPIPAPGAPVASRG